ncbi:MAG: amidohydrolase family protein [Enhygromyxa sp.]
MRGVLLGALLSVGACRGDQGPEQAPPPALEHQLAHQRHRLDAHVHLVGGAVDELLAALDRKGIARAVVLASPHLDLEHLVVATEDPFAGWRAANERLLRDTAEHRERLLPFVTVEPAELAAGELEAWLERGACGVKLYLGHRSFRRHPLDDPRYAATFELLERLAVPVLFHVNTARYEAELHTLLDRYPKLEIVCPHLCGSRTDLDRLARILRLHPSLRVDTSHGPGKPGVDGFTKLEAEGARLRALIEAAPDRFLFGSDLVTVVTPGLLDATRAEWDRQIAANLGLLEAERFEFWRIDAQSGQAKLGEYAGLDLGDAVLEQVLATNAERWLRSCAPERPGP